MHAAPSPAGRSGLRAGKASFLPLLVMTVLEYGADMIQSVRGGRDSSQSAFGADLAEALTACAELINTGRGGLRGGAPGTVEDVQAFGERYAFHGIPAGPGDVPRLRSHRERLDAIAMACERGDDEAAIGMLNSLLKETGAIPQIVAHDGRGPHIHVSRPAAPLADRIAAHLAMGLAQLVVAGQGGRMRTCASPTCRNVFVDESRNQSRRYCDSRTCGNRQHVAAYRARRLAAG
jgi:predicted RNA-binding Zn ribbon-like protein